MSKNLPVEYQRWDWKKENLAEWHKIKVGGIVIVEGVYSTRKELADFYDFKIWVECPRDVRLARGLERDSETARKKWEKEWMPAEDSYVANEMPRERADLIINGYE